MATATETDRDGLIAGYAALAIVIHILEAGLPSPVPGIKPGLANVITLVVLSRHGWNTAAWVVMLRVLVSSLLLGSFLTPTFLLSASGAIASLAGLWLLDAINRLGRREIFTLFGMGMLSACLHISGQFAVAYRLFVPHPGLLNLLPVLATSALAFGLTTGWLARSISEKMRTHAAKPSSAAEPPCP